MQKLTLIFAKVDKPISKLIRVVTRSSWSRVGIVSSVSGAFSLYDISFMLVRISSGK